MSVYQEVTNQIVSELENGAAPWVKPWAVSGANEMPYNASSGRRYSGTNVLLLWLHTAAKGYSRPAYITFNQARQAGGSVRKGERSIGVVFTSTFEKGEGEDKKVIPFAKTTPVFNIDQCDGLPEAWYGKPVLVGTGYTVELGLKETLTFTEDSLKAVGFEAIEIEALQRTTLDTPAVRKALKARKIEAVDAAADRKMSEVVEATKHSHAIAA